MTIDKSWIHLRRRLSAEYCKGVRTFIELAKNHMDNRGMVRCPCKSCINIYFQTLKVVEAHIFNKGFDVRYDKWVYYGFI